jgi:Arc/MetJ-type ribon-helix-helix transcriptional regulator
MEATLKPEVEKLIEEEVKSGRSVNGDDFLDKAVYHYVVARDLGEDYTREEVEEKISRALAQADRGESISGEEAFRRLRAHAKARAQEIR